MTLLRQEDTTLRSMWEQPPSAVQSSEARLFLRHERQTEPLSFLVVDQFENLQRSRFTAPREYLPTLRVRSVGGRLAQEMGARRRGSRPLCGRHYPRIPASDRSRSFPGKLSGTAGNVWAGAPSRQDAPDRVRTICRTKPGTNRGRQAGNVRLSRLHAHLREEWIRAIHGAAHDDPQTHASQTARG